VSDNDGVASHVIYAKRDIHLYLPFPVVNYIEKRTKINNNNRYRQTDGQTEKKQANSRFI